MPMSEHLSLFVSSLHEALMREIAFIETRWRVPKRIRLNLGVPVGSMVSAPIVEDTELGRRSVILGIQPAYEILIHPADWHQLVEGICFATVEPNMRRDGASEDEIDVMKANAYANPGGFQVVGIPVVDDTPKVFP